MSHKDPEERAAYQKAWREKNPERSREIQREWQERNKEHVAEYRRQHYLKNRERVLARIKAQREADPEAFKAKKAEQARRRRARDPEKHRLTERARHIKRKYDLTLEEYDAILARGCGICGSQDRRLCMDHDHSNGKVRDALCQLCNTGLGAFDDDPTRLIAAAKYIETHRQGATL